MISDRLDTSSAYGEDDDRGAITVGSQSGGIIDLGVRPPRYGRSATDTSRCRRTSSHSGRIALLIRYPPAFHSRLTNIFFQKSSVESANCNSVRMIRKSLASPLLTRYSSSTFSLVRWVV